MPVTQTYKAGVILAQLQFTLKVEAVRSSEM